jgi:hypothetical protein
VVVQEAYEPVLNTAYRLDPVVPSDDGNDFITAFFQRQIIMLPIVAQKLFLEHRQLYYTQNIIKYGFSWSLEYAIYAVIADNPDKAEHLALKAKMLLDMEISGRVTTLGSIQASILLGWRECGSEKAGHHCATAVGLAVDFGIHIDPSNFVSTRAMTMEEQEARRFMSWVLFVFDR